MVSLDERVDEEYVVCEVRLDDGGIIIYDPANEDAWVQADSPTLLDDAERVE